MDKLAHPQTGTGNIRELRELTNSSDTRDYLYEAARQARKQYDHYELIIDVDAHLQEGRFWPELIKFMGNDVLEYSANAMLKLGIRSPLINAMPGMGFQSLDGRIAHAEGPREEVVGSATPSHAFAEIVRRGMDAMGLDYQIIFPTSMLYLSMNPMEEVEVHMAQAYNRWLREVMCPQDKRFIGFAYLPFNSPEECEKIVQECANDPQIVGFTICSIRNKPIHHNKNMRLFSMIEETGKPIAMHSGLTWTEPSFAQLNRFISMHALSFVHYSLIHLTNWIINALPERFPKIKIIWIESGLAWVPYLMQRLDHEVLLRPSEAPGLKRLPSEYIREMYFSSQPLERHDMKLLESTMTAINAETQLLFASDWPHWDFDPPSSITTIPFLSDQAKRNILGLNAAKLFNLPVKRMRPPADQVLSDRDVERGL